MDNQLADAALAFEVVTALRKTVGYDRTTGHETYLSPKVIPDSLGPFDLDPFTPEEGMPWATAARMIKPSEDGFKVEWPKTAYVYLNSPYGSKLRPAMAKGAEHGNNVNLVFARIETQAMFESFWRHPNATGFLVFEGRLKFCDLDGQELGCAGAPSMLLLYGQHAVSQVIKALKAEQIFGRLMVFGADQADTWQLGRRPPARRKSAKAA